MSDINPDDLELWQSFRKANSHLINARAKLQSAKNLNKIIESGFINRDFIEVLQLIPMLSEEDKSQFLPQLLEHASYSNGLTQEFQKAILSFPKEWLIKNLPVQADKLLVGEHLYEEYIQLMSLFRTIDAKLSLWLAKKAILSDNSDIREVGQEELDRPQKLLELYSQQQ